MDEVALAPEWLVCGVGHRMLAQGWAALPPPAAACALLVLLACACSCVRDRASDGAAFGRDALRAAAARACARAADHRGASRSLEATRETLGARHPDTLTSISNLGSLLYSQRNYSEADPLLREVLQSRRETLGDRHPDTLISIGNMARLLQAQGKLDEAEPLWTSSLYAQEQVGVARIRWPRDEEVELTSSSVSTRACRESSWSRQVIITEVYSSLPWPMTRDAYAFAIPGAEGTRARDRRAGQNGLRHVDQEGQPRVSA